MYGPGFSVVEISFNVFVNDPHVAAASDSASVSNGSRPLGKAPACLETTNVLGPAATEPVEVVAHPETRVSTASTDMSWIFMLFSMVVY
jgi:hypothetical protein